jgi:hypothetical protein
VSNETFDAHRYLLREDALLVVEVKVSSVRATTVRPRDRASWPTRPMICPAR